MELKPSNCLIKISVKIVASLQSAYLLGRTIHETIFLSNEMVHRALEDDTKLYALIKLDVFTTFDTTKWVFTQCILEHIGIG